MTQFFQTIITGLGDSALYLMVSLGLTLIFGTLGVVNFAQGDVMTVAAYVGYAVVVGIGLTPLLGLTIMVPALAILGAVFYFAILAPTRNATSETQVLATFGVALLLEGIVTRIWSATPKSIPLNTGAFDVGGVSIPTTTLRNIVIAAICLVLLFGYLFATPLGAQSRAAAQDPVGAELIGVNTGRAFLATTVISFALTAIGGLMLVTTTVLQPTVGSSYVLVGFAVVTMGGLGSVGGSVIASIVLGLATELVSTYIAIAYASVVPFVVIVLVLLLRPRGLLGKVVR